MFANSIIAQSQNQKIGSSTVANPIATVTSDSDCGCGGSTNQGLIASSQKLGDCVCGGHEEDNQPQGLAKRPSSTRTTMSGGYWDCETRYYRRRTGEDTPLDPAPYTWESEEECEWVPPNWEVVTDWVPDVISSGTDPKDDPPPKKIPNCPNCINFRKNYKEIKDKIDNPSATISPEATNYYNFLKDTFKKMLQNVYNAVVNMNDKRYDDILMKYEAINYHKFETDPYMKILLQRYLDTIVKDISETETDAGKCLSVLQVGFDLVSGRFEFVTENFNGLFGRSYLFIDHRTYYPKFEPETKIYSDFSIGMQKKTKESPCDDDVYKMYEFKNGSWNLSTI